ncbi:integrator complex subunit 7-like [Hibiscus syriacus]|uniref:integrator complex subunit 7-like n=1 Tax=Hibiscus syriacus TaxID=106335 RepID=UPI0019219D4E|nr:integrator complex subunit 7-like [Hibiscus syriacus]
MDKISAASAMEWSIQLDKALRSNNPARAAEAILQTGQRLELWGREPEATKAVLSIFGLVPGEDRLFANTILLRLADAFRFGDKKIRLSVVRIFLTNIRCDKSNKHRNQKRRTFPNSRVYNHEELLRRVKVVLDTGDVESRAMALVLFGCWADFAKDSAEIRYLVLSSMVSSDNLEVKASLFAASRFCELTDDFASVVLEMLANMMAAQETPEAARLAGVSVFT